MEVQRKDMTRNDIIRLAKSTSFYNLVPFSSIQTAKDVQKLSEQGFETVVTEKEIKDAFPGIDTTHLFHSPVAIDAPVFYWDEENLIAFPIYLYGLHFLVSPSGNQDLVGTIARIAGKIKKHVEARDFSFIHTTLNDTMRAEYVGILIDKGLISYSEFREFYEHLDYGSGAYTAEHIKKILSKATPEDRAETERRLAKKKDVLTVYRGVSSLSTPLNKALSWTLSPSVAMFFAVWRADYEAEIYEATIKKSEILEYITSRNEEEVLLMPGAVQNIKRNELYGLQFLEEFLPEASPRYHEFLDRAEFDEEFQDAVEASNYASYSSYAVHTLPHSARVFLLCLVLGDLYHLSNDDIDILADAALYHDIGRTHDAVETGHGDNSAILYRRFSSDTKPIAEFLIQYHCRPDKEGWAFIKQHFGSEQKRVRLLYNIFKDADGLDRVRLGLKELNISMLRTEEAKKLPLVANLLLENIKFNEE